jgi:hypothetical protein
MHSLASRSVLAIALSLLTFASGAGAAVALKKPYR